MNFLWGLSAPITLLGLLGFVLVTRANEGTSFLIGFSIESNRAVLFIRAVLAGNDFAVVNAIAPHSPDLLNTTAILDAAVSSSVHFRIRQKLAVDNSQKYPNHGVMVESTAAITVVVFTDIRYDVLKTSSAFLVFPVRQLSTSYVVLTSCPEGKCLVMIASFLDATEVGILLKAKTTSSGSHGNVTYNGVVYPSGDDLTIWLQAYDLMQILGEATDLSGTRVVSNQPVAVICGGVYGINGTYQGKMVEQVPPTESLGEVFVLRGVAFTSASHHVARLITAHPNTTLHFSYASGNVTTEFIEHENTEHEQMLEADVTTVLRTDKPVLVSLEVPASNDMTPEMHPGQTLVMPQSTWRTHFLLPVHHKIEVIPTIHLVLETSADCAHPFLINGFMFPGTSWSVTERYKSASFLLDTDSYSRDQIVNVTNCGCEFGGFVLGLGAIKALAFPLGWPIENSKEKVQCPESTAYGMSTNGSFSNEPTTPTSTDSNSGLNNPSFNATNTTTSNIDPGVDKTASDISRNVSNGGNNISTHMTSPIIGQGDPSLSQAGQATKVIDRALKVTTSKVSKAESIVRDVNTLPRIATSSVVQVRTSTLVRDELTEETTTMVSFYGVSQSLGSTEISSSSAATTPSRYIASAIQVTETFLKEATSAFNTESILDVYSTATASTSSLVENDHTSQIARYLSTTSTAITTASEVSHTTGGNGSPRTKSCLCKCPRDLDRIANISREEREILKETIVRRLQLPVSSLSQAKRKKTSATDGRMTPTILGSVVTGVVFAVVAASILVPDVMSIVHIFWYDMKRYKI